MAGRPLQKALVLTDRERCLRRRPRESPLLPLPPEQPNSFLKSVLYTSLLLKISRERGMPRFSKFESCRSLPTLAFPGTELRGGGGGDVLRVTEAVTDRHKGPPAVTDRHRGPPAVWA